MPTIRKLSTEEVAEFKAPKLSSRQKIAQEYDEMLDGFDLGDWGEIELGDDDNRLTVRSRLQAAGARRDLHLSFHRSSGNIVRFVVEKKPQTAPAEQTSEPKKRGRKPKVAVQS